MTKLENTKEVTDSCEDRRELLWKGTILAGACRNYNWEYLVANRLNKYKTRGTDVGWKRGHKGQNVRR